MGLIKTINDLKNVFPNELTNEFVNSMTRRELTQEEKSLPYSKYYYKDMAKIPEQDLKLASSGAIDKSKALPFSSVQQVIEDGYCEVETGYCSMGDGTGFAATKVFMKDVKLEMLDWWFNWHPLHDLRYAIWCPVGHNGISAKEPSAHLDSSGVDLKVRNYGKTHYPDEGFNLEGHEVVSIHFKDPKDMGIDIKNTRVYVANVTKKIGFYELLITTFVHVAREVEGGVEYRSRYYPRVYINKKNQFKKCKIKFPQSLITNWAKNNCMHSLVEYNNLGDILPHVYSEFCGKII